MKFTQKLNLLVEGIGSSRNVYRSLPSFTIDKDKKFLRMTDFLYGLKKLIQYVNEEIEDYNKKAKVKIPFYKLEIKKDATNVSVKKEITENILEFIDNKLDRDLFKKQLIKTLLELFKDQNEYSNFYTFCEDNIKNITVSITSTNDKYSLTHSVISHPNVSYKSFIHEFVMHVFLNPKDIQKFDLSIHGYDFISSHRFSPGSILNELVALQTDLLKHYYDLTNNFITSIKDDFKKIIENTKADNSNIKEQNFIEKKFNELFNLKNKVLIQKLRNILLNDKIEDFNFDELKTISILLKNSPYKQYFKLTLDYYLDEIISNQRISSLSGDKKTKTINGEGSIIEKDDDPFYEFIERVIESIKFRKNKLSKDKDQTVIWKDFRTYFRDYPHVLKLFPESKYPDNKIIFDHTNLQYDLMDLLPKQKLELVKINRIITNAVRIGQVLTKKSRTGTFDIENKEDKIDFVIERFSKLLKNQFNDNSKYYKMIDKELK